MTPRYQHLAAFAAEIRAAYDRESMEFALANSLTKLSAAQTDADALDELKALDQHVRFIQYIQPKLDVKKLMLVAHDCISMDLIDNAVDSCNEVLSEYDQRMREVSLQQAVAELRAARMQHDRVRKQVGSESQLARLTAQQHHQALSTYYAAVAEVRS